MSPRPAPPTVLPGYRLLEPLGSGGFGEVWKCEAPGGLVKALKIVRARPDALPGEPAPALEELQAIHRVKAVRHPFVLSLERVELVGDDLVIVMELADQSLHDLLTTYQAANLPGVPRDELLDYLEEAAEALDVMNLQHGLQHLDVKPRNLFLVGGHVKVGDFGLVSSLASRSAGLECGAVTPLYAAPEVFQNTLSDACDQYSLAIVYQELLTGTLPFGCKTARQLMLLHCTAEPDLSPLPEHDRPIVGRALSKLPANRFASCGDFIHALVTATWPVPASRPAPEPPSTSDTMHELSVGTTSRGLAVPHLSAKALEVTPRVSSPFGGGRLLTKLKTSPVLETWQALDRDGKACLGKVVFGFVQPDAQAERVAIGRLSALAHPGLVPLDIIQYAPGRLTLLSKVTGRTLRDLFQECQADGEPGVPREELIGCLLWVAQVLDHFQQTQGLQHLGLTPRHVVIDEDRARVTDFGLAQLLWLPGRQDLGSLNARYAAPELLARGVSPRCDQYSLALIYQEMLTGTLPRSGPGSRGGQEGVPLYLGPLPEYDRPLVARALADDPRDRWESCTEFLRALEDATPADAPVAATSPAAPAETEDAGAVDCLLRELVAGPVSRDHGQGGLAFAGAGVQQRFTSRLSINEARGKLRLLCRAWHGRVTRDDGGVFAFQVAQPAGFWRRLTGLTSGLTVRAALSPTAEGCGVRVRAEPFGVDRGQGRELLRTAGPYLLEEVGLTIQAASERRGRDRLLLQRPVRVRFVLPSRELGRGIDCAAKDLSLTGIGFHLPGSLYSHRILVETTAAGQPVSLPAQVVRARRAGDGYEAGAAFTH